MTDQAYKYFAFISYNAKDTDWGKKLQKKLEHYKLPSTLCREHGWKRKPINPVFFAPTDIQPGGLSEELQERLKASRNLIVICSPNSAKSKWVGKEIEYFHHLGRTNNIHFFIVDGSPNSGNPETECFNPVIDQLELPEILGANIHEKIYRWPWLNKERAYVQLISKMLGVEFDAIWQRHKRKLIKQIVAWLLGSLVVIAALLYVWRSNQPIEMKLRLNEASVHNGNLPPLKDAIVTMWLDNETKTDTLHSLSDNLVFSNIPHRFLNKPVQFTVTCRDFIDVDTALIFTKTATLNIYRDPSVYGDIFFTLFNVETETNVANETLQIEGKEVTTDEKGQVSLFIPLNAQKRAYKVKANIPLLNDSISMPHGEYDVVMTK